MSFCRCCCRSSVSRSCREHPPAPVDRAIAPSLGRSGELCFCPVVRRVSRLPAPARSFAGSLVRWLAPRVTARLVALSHPVQWRDRSSTALHQPGPCISTVPKQRRRNVRCTYRCVLVTCSRADAVSWPRPLAQSLRAQSKKKPNKKLISCPFCLGEFEDVTLHLESCSSATGGGGGGGWPAAASTASSPSVATPT